jgi:hypothetical protein
MALARESTVAAMLDRMGEGLGSLPPSMCMPGGAGAREAPSALAACYFGALRNKLVDGRSGEQVPR